MGRVTDSQTQMDPAEGWRWIVEMPMLLSVSEAARKLGLCERTFREFVRSGKIGSVQIGSRNRKIPLAALEAFIEQETEGGSK